MSINIEYYKECFENHICPKCGSELNLLISIDGLECEYCDEIFYPLNDPYNMEFDRIYWHN